jgi:RNA polymerase subunit RPABC4/transcription elongation factor Spt4
MTRDPDQPDHAPDDEWQEHELPDPADLDDPDEPALMACPLCRKMVHEDAEWCHHCGYFLLEVDQPPSRWFWLVLVVLLVLLLSGAWVLVR